MIDIPLGKALVPVESINSYDCEQCYLFDTGDCLEIQCYKEDRKDGENVIFKLLDYQVKEINK